MKRIFFAVLIFSSAAMADSVECSKTVKGSSDGTMVITNYAVPVVNGAALINLYTKGDNGRDQQADRFIAMSQVVNGVVTLVRVIDHTDNTFAEIYSQADMVALQKGGFKTTVACQVVP